MDKAEYQMKLDQINRLVDREEYDEAANIADNIDWRRVKSVRTLNLIGSIYEVNKRYEEAKKIFLLANKRAPISKSILCSLVEVYLSLGEYDEAVEYYSEFAKNAPNDNTKYILKYKIYKARRSPIQDQIAILEEYKEREYTERWAYELAKLYHRAGMTKECVELCDDMILWFSDGKYVIKAMELKMRYVQLTPSQRTTYEKQNRVQQSEAPTAPKVTMPKVDTNIQASIGAGVGVTQIPKPAYMSPDSINDAFKEASVTKEETRKVEPINIPDIGDIQSKLAQGIRSVFSGGAEVNHKMDDLSANEIASIMQDTTVIETEDESAYEDVKALEPEQIGNEPIQIEKSSIPKKPVQSYAVQNQDKNAVIESHAEFDLEALMAETATSLAQEVATGDYEQTALVEEEKKIAKEKAAAKEASRKEAAAKEAARKAALDQEAESEDLSLTREFNFDKELKEFKEKVVATQKKLEEAEKQESKLEKLKQVDEFVLPPDILAEIEAKKAKVLESVPLMTAPIVEDFKIVPPSERGKAPLKEEYKSEALEESDKLINTINSEDMIMDSGDSTADENVVVDIAEESKEIVEDSLANSAVPVDTVPVDAIPVDAKPVDAIPVDVKPVDAVLVDAKPEIDIEQLEKLLTESNDEKEKEEKETTKEFDVESVAEARNNIETQMVFTDEVKPRKFNKEEKRIFTYFSAIPGMDVQLTTAIEEIRRCACDKTSKTGNVVIMGRHGSGKTRLSEALIHAACKNLEMEAVKIAYLDASDMNAKDPVQVVAKMAGGFLVIERAAYLNDDTVEKLSKALDFRTDALTVILEDEKDNMRDMLKKRPEFAKKFGTVVTIPVFTNDELVTFAKTYASERGFKMDDMGVLALYTLIGDNQNESEPITIGRVKDMVDDAIKCATRGTRKLGRKFSKKHIDEQDRIILYEKDFDF